MKATLSAALAIMLFANLPPGQVLADTQVKYQALKQWCAGRDKWAAEGGKTDYPNPNEYFHFHHYCFALKAMNNINSTIDIDKQRAATGTVVGETGYVITHVPEHHFLMPEMYAIRGRAQLAIKQNSKAEESLNKALQLDPRYTDVYASLGNLYLNTNRKEKAAEVTQTGLAIDPQHRALLRLAGKLGIKLEEVKTESDKPQPPSSAELKPSDSTELIQNLKPALPSPSSTSAETEPPKQDVDKAAKEDSSKSSNTDAQPTNIGTPRNPWCRFCPDTPAKADPWPSNP